MLFYKYFLEFTSIPTPPIKPNPHHPYPHGPTTALFPSHSMKIKGYINYGYRPPAPFIAVMISIKELSVEAKIPFLIDTGASSTIILWRDIASQNFHYRSIKD